MLEIALYQPDIAQNTGNIIRLSSCLGLKVNIIEPCGFLLSDKMLKRSAMDYLDNNLIRNNNYQDFYNMQKKSNRRIILFSSKSSNSYIDFKFRFNDTLIFGSESRGVDGFVDDSVDDAVVIPMLSGKRCFNLASSVAIGVSEALRQIGYFKEIFLNES